MKQHEKCLERKKITESENRSLRRKLGIIMFLLLPCSILFITFYRIGQFAGQGISSSSYKLDFLFALTYFTSTIGIFTLIPGLAMALLRDSNYNPHISLKTSEDDLNDVYNENYNLDNLPKQDLELMKHHGFIGNLKLIGAVILNIISLGLFGTVYVGVNNSYLPLIKKDDYTATKAIGFLFIPLFNIYWLFKFWIRFVNRINFQFKLRGEKAPVSKELAIAMCIITFIPYINLSNIILSTILIYQIQKAILKLSIENK